MTRVVLYGASELGRDVASMVPALEEARPDLEVVGFVDDRAPAGSRVLDLPVLGGGDWLAGAAAGEGLAAVVTIGDPAVRARIVERLTGQGVPFATLVHPAAVLTRWVELGEGTMVMAGCTFTADVRIGRHVVFNPGCTVAHDVVVGDYVYVSPGVDLAGRVVLEPSCYLGTGAVVIPSRTVGARSVVGAGAVVVRDVPPDVTVAGVPARVLTRTQTEPGRA